MPTYLAQDTQEILQELTDRKDAMTIPQISSRTGIPERRTRAALARLREKGLARALPAPSALSSGPGRPPLIWRKS